MEELETIPAATPRIHFRFPPAPAPGKVVCEAQGLVKRFLHKILFGPLDFQIGRGERIAFIGRNGMGKTTLARILAGQMDYEGYLKHGYNVLCGFYSQDVASAHNPAHTVLEEMEAAAAPYESFTEVRNILGAFLFSDDSVYKKTSVLSGGEKSRLALAKLLVQPFNFLILDEPTNHLDMASKEILQQALQAFSGTLVVVSHDRDFVRGLCQHTWEFTLEGIRMCPWDVDEVLRRRGHQHMRAYAEESKASETVARAHTSSRETSRELRRLRQNVVRWEKEIERLEAEISHLDAVLADPAACMTHDPEIFPRYDELKNRLAEAWDRLADASEALSEKGAGS